MLKRDINVRPSAYGTNQGCISLVRAIHAACPSLAAKTIVALCPRVSVWISVCVCVFIVFMSVYMYIPFSFSV